MKKTKYLSLLFFTLVLCLFLTSNIVFAAVGSEYLFSGGFPSSNIQDLRYVLSGGDSNYQQNIMSAGANMWNNVSSNVNVSLNSSGAKVSIYKSSQTHTPGLMGQTVPYYTNWLGGLSVDYSGTNIWTLADIFGYDNQMAASSYTTADKKAIYAHEMGHALSLKHNDSDLLLMNTNAQLIIIAGYPRNDDKGNLRLKWGY